MNYKLILILFLTTIAIIVIATVIWKRFKPYHHCTYTGPPLDIPCNRKKTNKYGGIDIKPPLFTNPVILGRDPKEPIPRRLRIPSRRIDLPISGDRMHVASKDILMPYENDGNIIAPIECFVELFMDNTSNISIDGKFLKLKNPSDTIILTALEDTLCTLGTPYQQITSVQFDGISIITSVDIPCVDDDNQPILLAVSDKNIDDNFRMRQWIKLSMSGISRVLVARIKDSTVTELIWYTEADLRSTIPDLNTKLQSLYGSILSNNH